VRRVERLAALVADRLAEGAREDASLMGTHEGATAADDFAWLAGTLRGITLDGEARPPAAAPPAARWWKDAVDLGGEGSSAALAGALDALAGDLRWFQGQYYPPGEIGEAYQRKAGSAEILGPHGSFHSDRLTMGVFIMGPGLYYPPHAHPATEVYCVVGGTAQWRRGDEPWAPRPPGSLIHHPGGVAHAMNTGDEAMLAVYLWRGDLDTPPWLIGEP
jgi:quercetin dioxygenase-like cupin family protein